MDDAQSAQRITQSASGKVTVRDAVIHLLRGFGCTTMFGNPGSTELPLFRDWPSDFRYVLGLQESVVLGMADGYAQATGNAAVVNLHSAAGVGHALGNLFTAWKNNAPVVVIAGQQARSMLPMDPFLGATAAPEFPKPYVKFSIEPARAEEWIPVLAASLGAPPSRVPAELPHGRPLSNALARSRGWIPRFPSWRDGFTAADAGVAVAGDGAAERSER